MGFLSKLDEYYNFLNEQPENQDAAMPQPETNVVSPVPEAPTDKPQEKQVNVPPEGYVNILRLLTKALVMDVPASELDSLLTGQEITKENAYEMQKAIDAVMKDNEVKSDNISRLNNPNYKKFVDSINERNFMEKYKYILNAMKKKSPYIQ